MRKKANSVQIIDTYPSFKDWWENTKHDNVETQIENWFHIYMSKYPELRDKQINDYQNSGDDWKKIAERYIFKNMDEKIDRMDVAHQNLIEILPLMSQSFNNTFRIDFKTVFVIYVGIGLGAGWATKYDSTPAILFGLENIADENWEDSQTLKGLTAHEMGHLFHFNLREKMCLKVNYESKLWQLYEEGFAMRFEHKIMKEDTWHQQKGKNNWIEWCEKNKKALTHKFLHYLDQNLNVNDFFGSWFNIDGYSQTGYYLGHEIIKEWEKTEDFELIATLSIEEIEKKVKRFLLDWSV